MPSLYSTLFEHWRGNNREALEPFLTRALADLLQRIGQHDVQSVRDLIFGEFLNPHRRTSGPLSAECFTNLQTAVNATDEFGWVAEFPIPGDRNGGIIDLCLFLNGFPALV